MSSQGSAGLFDDQGVAGSHHSSNARLSPLRLEVKIVSATYCAFTSDFAKLRLGITLQLRNLTSDRLVLRKIGFPVVVFVARTKGDIAKGKYELSMAPETLGFGKPQPMQELNGQLGPGESIEVPSSEIFVPVSIGQSHRGVEPGKHLLQIEALVELGNPQRSSVESFSIRSLTVPLVVEVNPTINMCKPQ